MAGPEALSSRDSQSLDKVPPHSLEAEEALLGSALLSRDAVSRLMEEVRPADFYSPSNQTVYEAMKGLFDTGKPIDTVTCLLYTSPSPRDRTRSRMPSSA